MKEVRIKIPTAVKRGDSAILDCRYDLEGDRLYSVKWYKGRREFYRYTPNENPSIKTFPIGSLTVNVSRVIYLQDFFYQLSILSLLQVNESNSNRVYIPELDLDATGRYSCEVSADAPSFQTAIVSANMNIVGTFTKFTKFCIYFMNLLISCIRIDTELPLRGPTVHGLKHKYRVGDILRGNCTSDSSRPAANLTWYINDRQVIQIHEVYALA